MTERAYSDITENKRSNIFKPINLCYYSTLKLLGMFFVTILLPKLLWANKIVLDFMSEGVDD